MPANAKQSCFRRLSSIAMLLAVGALAATPSLSNAAGPEPSWSAKRLFDGKSLRGWKVTDFGGQAEVEVRDRQIILPVGHDMTGVTWSGDPKEPNFQLPGEDYELRLEARRLEGSDFFCGLTFPVGEDPCSLILGGWGGGVVGLSSIGGYDASENETTQYVEFQENRWYRVRVRVTKDKVECWLDDERIIGVARENREFSVRIEMELSRPLGIATWRTKGAIRNVSLHRVAASQVEEEASPSDLPPDLAPPEPPPAPAATTACPPKCRSGCAPRRLFFRRGARRCR